MPRPLTCLLLVALAAAPSTAGSNGDGAAAGPPTVFERFVLSACTPVRAGSRTPSPSLRVAPIALPGFPRAAAASGARPGEIAVEVLRAYQPGRPDWKSLALRVTLSVATGPGGDLFRLGTGLLDGGRRAGARPGRGRDGPRSRRRHRQSRARTASTRISTAARSASACCRSAVTRSGTSRQATSPSCLQRAVWEVPTTLYVPVKDLPRHRDRPRSGRGQDRAGARQLSRSEGGEARDATERSPGGRCSPWCSPSSRSAPLSPSRGSSTSSSRTVGSRPSQRAPPGPAGRRGHAQVDDRSAVHAPPPRLRPRGEARPPDPRSSCASRPAPPAASPWRFTGPAPSARSAISRFIPADPPRRPTSMTVGRRRLASGGAGPPGAGARDGPRARLRTALRPAGSHCGSGRRPPPLPSSLSFAIIGLFVTASPDRARLLAAEPAALPARAAPRQQAGSASPPAWCRLDCSA